MQKDRSIRRDNPTDAVLSALLTGRRRRDRFCADVGGEPVWLPHGPFDALVDLAAACFRSETGLAKIDPLVIHRLRKALGDPGKNLIVNGSGKEYYLAISKAQAAELLNVAPCFFELAEGGFLAADVVELLRESCRCRKLVEDDGGLTPPRRKSKRNRKEIKRKSNGN